jgi:predicted permease
MFVSANYFSTVGVALARGPGFEASIDDAVAAPPVVILGYDFWQNRFGADADIVGKTLTLDGIQHVVVGVAPDQYHTHLRDDEGTQLFVPLERYPRLRADARLRLDRDVPWVRIHGRLSPGVSLAQANAAVSATMSRLAERHPASNQHKAASVEAYFSEGARERWEYLLLESVLLGLTGIILLVVCLNISGMMQVRVAMRERELSIRQAIGATRARLVAYLLSEAVMLAILGGALGALALFGAPPALAWWNEQPLPLVFQEAARPNLPIAALSVALCLATSLMFGLLPAIRFSRPAMTLALKDDAGGGSRRVGRIHRLTAALQVGIAVPFLVIGGVLVDQVRTTATADLGFQPNGLAALSMDLGGKQTKDVDFFLRAVRNNLQQASAIRSVTIADGLPLDFHSRVARVSRPGQSNVVDAHTTRVGEGYLETMAIPLLRGRGITGEDGVGTQLVAVISKPLADRLFGDDDPIGQRLTLAPGYSANAVPNRDETPLAIEGDRQPVFTVVGVTADFVTSQMSAPRAQMLVPLAQHPASPVFLVARNATEVPPATSTFQNAVGDVDPDFFPANPARVAEGIEVVTGDQLRQRGMRGYLGEAIVAGGGGGVVLILAALGIYGVVGFMVASRTREIAVRMALGASRRSVLRMVLSDVVKLVIPGVTGGLLLGILLTPMVASWKVLPGAVIYTVAGGIAISVALLAGLPPARRAASVEPMVAMRSE